MKLVKISAVLALCVVALGLVYVMSAQITVPADSMMAVRFKGNLVFPNKVAASGQWAKLGEVGPYREMLPAATYFSYHPWWYERVIVKKTAIRPGQLGKLTHLLGDPPPNGAQVAEGNLLTVTHKGIVRELLTPQFWNINPFGFKLEIIESVSDNVQTPSGTFTASAGWVNIRTGSVGVRTVKVPNPITGEAPGIVTETYQPGLYAVNPSTEQITETEIGYWLMSLTTKTKHNEDGTLILDEEGEPIIVPEGSEIVFRSKDGWMIFLDIDLVWGMMPDKAAAVLQHIGPRSQVESIIRNKVVSIATTLGSGSNGNEFLIGEKRESYQVDVEKEITKSLDAMGLVVLKALVKKVYVPIQVRQPIQTEYLAKEKELTAIEQQATAQSEATFNEAEKKVVLATDTATRETARLRKVSEAQAKKKAEIAKATNEQLIAAIKRETATLEAEASLIEGEAKAKGEQLVEEATAGRYELAVKAFGTPEAYSKFLFAENLSEELKINLVYVGSGTFWTDLTKAGINMTIPTESQSAK